MRIRLSELCVRVFVFFVAGSLCFLHGFLWIVNVRCMCVAVLLWLLFVCLFVVIIVGSMCFMYCFVCGWCSKKKHVMETASLRWAPGVFAWQQEKGKSRQHPKVFPGGPPPQY